MPLADLVVRNVQVVTLAGVFRGGVAARDGRIVAVGQDEDLPRATEVIDGRDRFLLPGRVDPHVHMGVHFPFDQDVARESEAAVVGGTTVMMPYNRAKVPYEDIYDGWVRAVEERSLCDFLFHLQIQTPHHLEEIPRYRERFGVLCYKLHLDYRVPAVAELDIAPLDDGDVFRCMEQTATFGGLVSVHCENVEVIKITLPRVRGTGRGDLAAWSESRPAFCEEADMWTMALLAEVTGATLYVPHMSIARGVEIKRHSRGRMVLETCVQYLTTFMDEHERIGAVAKVNPPLRDRSNAEGLWAGLRDGWIDTVGTDHIACEKHEGDDLWTVTAGMPSIEVALPALLTEGVAAGRLSWQRLVEVACLNPARIFHIDDRKGSIEVGKDADLVLVDMAEERRVSPQTTHSRFKTPLNGKVLRGWPVLTTLRGEVVFRDGKITGRPGRGRVLRSY